MDTCLAVTAGCLFVISVALVLRGDAVKSVTRHCCLWLLMSVLLLRDILSDLFTDFWKNKDVPVQLPGEVVVITGGARGIGEDVVRKLLRSGVCVVVGCRNERAGHSLLQRIRTEGVETGHLESYTLDLTSMASVKTFAETILENHAQIHVLVNNAGITIPERTLTEDGVESTFSINYLGHAYLTHLLLPRLVATARTASRSARVVNVSSCVHSYPFIGDLHIKDFSLRHNYHEYVAYGQSKAAQVMFTKTLDAKLRASGLPVQVHAVHPGVVFTHMMTQNIVHWILPFLLPFLLRTSESAARCVFYACASPELESRGGTYVTSCEVTKTGGVTNSETLQKQLWVSTLDLLNLKDFGGMLN